MASQHNQDKRLIIDDALQIRSMPAPEAIAFMAENSVTLWEVILNLLEEVYAGRGDLAIIETLELTCPAWENSIFLCDGFEDHSLFVPELGEYKLFTASAIGVDKPSRDNRGSQTVNFVIDNVPGDEQKLIIKAFEERALAQVRVRTYLSNDLSQPASNTLTASVKSVQIKGPQVQVTAGFFDVIARNFNRLTYNSNTSPALMYE